MKMGRKFPEKWNPSNTVQNRDPGATIFRCLLGNDSNTTKTTTITEKSACMQAKEFARNLEAEDELEEWEVTNNVPKKCSSEPKIQKYMGRKLQEGTHPIQYTPRLPP